MCKKVPEENAKGKERLSVRWCDVNKGDSSNMAGLSRPVGTRISVEGSVHAGDIRCHSTLGKAPVHFHWVQTCRRGQGQKLDIKLLVLDISRAHFHPPAVRELYITLPEEDSTPGMVGQFLRTLYRTRDAAHEWSNFANMKIAAVKYHVGLSSPCICVRNTEPSIGWRHSDDKNPVSW